MGLQNLDAWHLVVVALIGLFIFGPDKLPRAISDGVTRSESGSRRTLSNCSV